MRTGPWLLLLGLLAASPARAGLFGNDAPGRIPVPAREFHARVEDRAGVVTELDHVTFDGEVYVFGTVGLAQVTVPFETIRRLEIAPGPDDDHVIARVFTKAGETWEVVVDEDRPVYGRAAFGNYRIDVSRIRTFEPR